MTYNKYILATVLLGVLSGCGGGGSEYVDPGDHPEIVQHELPDDREFFLKRYTAFGVSIGGVYYGRSGVTHLQSGVLASTPNNQPSTLVFESPGYDIRGSAVGGDGTPSNPIVMLAARWYDAYNPLLQGLTHETVDLVLANTKTGVVERITPPQLGDRHNCYGPIIDNQALCYSRDSVTNDYRIYSVNTITKRPGTHYTIGNGIGEIGWFKENNTITAIGRHKDGRLRLLSGPDVDHLTNQGFFPGTQAGHKEVSPWITRVGTKLVAIWIDRTEMSIRINTKPDGEAWGTTSLFVYSSLTSPTATPVSDPSDFGYPSYDHSNGEVVYNDYDAATDTVHPFRLIISELNPI